MKNGTEVNSPCDQKTGHTEQTSKYIEDILRIILRTREYIYKNGKEKNRFKMELLVLTDGL